MVATPPEGDDTHQLKKRKSKRLKKKSSSRVRAGDAGDEYENDFEAEDGVEEGVSADYGGSNNDSQASAPDGVKEWLSNNSLASAEGTMAAGDDRKRKSQSDLSGAPTLATPAMNTTIKGFHKAVKGGGGGGDEMDSLPAVSPRTGTLASPPISARSNDSQAMSHSLPALLSARSNQSKRDSTSTPAAEKPGGADAGPLPTLSARGRQNTTGFESIDMSPLPNSGRKSFKNGGGGDL